MFTLDEITLFFWNLSNDARSKREGATKDKFVASWVGATRETSHEARASAASESQSSHALARSKPSNLRTSRSISSRSVQSSQAVVNIAAGKCQLSDDDAYADEVGGWPMSDYDELEGVECEEARNSPLKGKQRANNKVRSRTVLSLLHRYLRHISQGLVVVKRHKESKPPSKRKHTSNQTSLPPECHIDNMWTKQVIPTLIYWLGRQKTPWYPTPNLVLEALRTTCQELYIPKVVEKVPLDRKEDEPFVLVSVFLWIQII